MAAPTITPAVNPSTGSVQHKFTETSSTATPSHTTDLKQTLTIQKPTDQFIFYRERWLILWVCCVLALSNAMQWIGYVTLTPQIQTFYCDVPDGCDPASDTNQIFQIVAVITGLFGMYVTDNYGIRVSINCGTALNFVGSVIRLISSLPSIGNNTLRVYLLHIGSFIAAAAQAFFLVLPSKVAECWFPVDQRALSNVLTFIANPGGVAMGTLTPQIFFDLSSNETTFHRESYQLFYYNSIMVFLTTLTIVSGFFIRRKVPLTPPSHTSAQHGSQAPPFWAAIKDCMTNYQFLIQLVTFGLGFALLLGFLVVYPDILFGIGYNFGGYASAVTAIVGVIGSIVAGIIADKTKKLKEIMKFFSVAFFFSAVFMRFYLAKTPTGSWFDVVMIYFGSALLGLFAIPQFPIGVELGVETTFPVLEATSSGLLVLSGQLWMFILLGLFRVVGNTYSVFGTNTRTSDGQFWEPKLDLWCVISLITALVAVFGVWPTYLRIENEEKLKKIQDQKSMSKEDKSGDLIVEAKADNPPIV